MPGIEAKAIMESMVNNALKVALLPGLVFSGLLPVSGPVESMVSGSFFSTSPVLAPVSFYFLPQLRQPCAGQLPLCTNYCHTKQLPHGLSFF
jgi:hypothetical protein